MYPEFQVFAGVLWVSVTWSLAAWLVGKDWETRIGICLVLKPNDKLPERTLLG
jgi:hypothetical protein